MLTHLFLTVSLILFLLLGKTTLLRHILDIFKSKNLRLAIIQNEAGSLGVEDFIEKNDIKDPLSDLSSLATKNDATMSTSFLPTTDPSLSTPSLSVSPLTSVLELGNGCICCSVKSDLVMAIEQLLTSPDKLVSSSNDGASPSTISNSPSLSPNFDYLILECSSLREFD
jgi:G3E family GTPase